MNAVKEWATVICLVTLVSALFQYLTPNGTMEKIIKMVLGVFVICGIIMPLAKLIPQISLQIQQSVPSAPNIQSYQNTVNNQICTAANAGIKTLVIKELCNMNIKCENVAVKMDTNESGSISISKIIVSINKSYVNQFGAISNRLENVLGLTTEVTADGGS